jgi:hypothetical protein
MIYFIEADTAGNICHVCADPVATIVPLVNRVLFSDASGAPLKDASGNDLSPQGSPLVLPVGISADTYARIRDGGIDNFTFDATTETVTAKIAPTPAGSTPNATASS